MPAAGNIGVGELVNEDQARTPLEGRIDVEFAEDAIDVDRRLARQNLKALQQRFSLPAAVRFDDPDNDVHALFELGARRLQHLIGLTNAWSGTNKDLQTAAASTLLSPRLSEQSLRRGTLFWVGALIWHRSI